MSTGPRDDQTELAEAEASKSVQQQIVALARLCEQCLEREDGPGAVRYGRRYLELVEQCGLPHLASIALGNVGVAERWQGHYDQAIQCYERQLKIVRALRDPTQMAVVLGNVGVLYAKLGRTPRALACFEEAKQLCEALLDDEGLSYSLVNLGALYVEQSEPDRARSCLVQATRLSEERGGRTYLGHALAGMVELCLAQGNEVEARFWLEKLQTVAAEPSPDEIVFRHRLLSARCLVSEDRQEAIAALCALQEDHGHGPRAAAISIELYRLVRDRFTHRRALDLHRELLARVPDIEYQRRIEELESSDPLCSPDDLP